MESIESFCAVRDRLNIHLCILAAFHVQLPGVDLKAWVNHLCSSPFWQQRSARATLTSIQAILTILW